MTGLNALLTDTYTGNELVVVGTPCNQFGLQEPATNDEIINCYHEVRPGGAFSLDANFLVSEKLDVNGLTEDSVYASVKSSCPPTKVELFHTASVNFQAKTTDITWNFEKFLVDTCGKPIKRYEPNYPQADMIVDINAVLNDAGACQSPAAKKVVKPKAAAKKEIRRRIPSHMRH